MKIKTGLLSLMIVCGACSRTTQPADVLKDNFDFASGQLNFAFSEIDQVKSAFTTGWFTASRRFTGLVQRILSGRIVVYV